MNKVDFVFFHMCLFSFWLCFWCLANHLCYEFILTLLDLLGLCRCPWHLSLPAPSTLSGHRRHYMNICWKNCRSVKMFILLNPKSVSTQFLSPCKLFKERIISSQSYFLFFQYTLDWNYNETVKQFVQSLHV